MRDDGWIDMAYHVTLPFNTLAGPVSCRQLAELLPNVIRWTTSPERCPLTRWPSTAPSRFSGPPCTPLPDLCSRVEDNFARTALTSGNVICDIEFTGRGRNGPSGSGKAHSPQRERPKPVRERRSASCCRRGIGGDGEFEAVAVSVARHDGRTVGLDSADEGRPFGVCQRRELGHHCCGGHEVRIRESGGVGVLVLMR